jgi:hypothetical protein
MICDACGEKYKQHESGHATLHVSPPRPDFKLFQALAAAGQSFEAKEPQTLDLCATCTSKTLAHLGLSTEIMELPQLPETAKVDDGDKDPERSNTGALTQEDLRTLGLLETAADQKI